MKRGKIAILLVVALFMVSGCGKDQTLSCTMETTSMGLTMGYGLEVDFKGDKVDDMSASITLEYPDTTTDEEKEVLNSTLKTQFEAQGFSYEETENGVKFSAGKDSSYFSTLNFDTKLKYDDAKEFFETNGFTCK